MKNIMLGQQSCLISLLCVLLFFSIIAAPEAVNSGSGQIVSGPYSLTIRGGGQSNSASLGFDARADYLNPLYNLHIFGTYDWLDSGSGIGEVQNYRYGAGLALSHTYEGNANAFIGTSFINELDEYFWHAYLGGKLKVADNAILSGSYGFGFGDEKEIIRNASWLFLAESVSWLKLGGVLVGEDGWKGNLYYYLTDPGDENISGVEGEISYPMTKSLTLGIRGSTDLTEKDDIDKNWQSYLFLTYSFGDKKGSPIDVALDKNNPVEYPKIIRKNKARHIAGPGVDGGGPLSVTITPGDGTGVEYCPNGGPGGSTIFTANVTGGTAPYTYDWTVSPAFVAIGSTTQQTVEICAIGGSGTLQVNVEDSESEMALDSISIIESGG